MNSVKIIYGTAWKKERTTTLVVSAVLNGFRAIDTACQPKHYREDLVGEALEVLHKQHGIRREDLFIQTKFTPVGGQDRNQPLPYDPSLSVPEQIAESFAKSLKNLRTTYLDSYVLHSPLETTARTLQAWRTLAALKADGRVRQIGLSNTYDVETLAMLEQETGATVEVVQNRWFERNNFDKEVWNFCHERGTQYQSFWTLTGSPHLLAHSATTGLAAEHKCTPEQVLFRIAQMHGITPLCGTTNEAHMCEAVAAEHVDIVGTSEHTATLQRILTGAQRLR